MLASPSPTRSTAAKIPTSPSPEPDPNSLISEKDVLFYRPALSKGRLLAARKAGIIVWTSGKRHSAWYRLAGVDAYLKSHLEQPCRAQEEKPSLHLVDSGSLKNLSVPASTVSGMTPELEELVALRS